MRVFWCLGLAVACIFLSAPARADAVSRVLGCKGDPCVVNYNGGGFVDRFERAAREINAGARKLVKINGPCLSACAMLADQARSHVCITPKARFGFHKAYEEASDGQILPESYTDQEQSSDIDSWVRWHGGYPYEGFTMMSYQEALRFWKRCP